MYATIPASFGPYVHIVPLQPDARVFTFILAAAVGAAVLFGLAPALQATRPSVVHAAKGNFDAEHRPSRLRNSLVVAQVTAATLLLIVSSVLLRNSHRMERIEPGIRRQQRAVPASSPAGSPAAHAHGGSQAKNALSSQGLTGPRPSIDGGLPDREPAVCMHCKARGPVPPPQRREDPNRGDRRLAWLGRARSAQPACPGRRVRKS
jgi:hypothetical protein